MEEYLEKFVTSESKEDTKGNDRDTVMEFNTADESPPKNQSLFLMRRI